MCLTMRVGAIAVALSVAQVLSAQNLVANGSIETHDFTGWNVVNASLLYNSPLAEDGDSYLVFGKEARTGRISQTLSTVVGASYLLRFAVQPDSQDPWSVTAQWGGVDAIKVDPFSVGLVNAWTIVSIFRTATSASTLLQFNFDDEKGHILFDDVSVTASSRDVAIAPEPSTNALVGAGLVALCMFARKRRLRTGRAGAAVPVPSHP
jgi:hypothetical protein